MTIVECKHLQRPVEVNVVRELRQRMSEVGAHKGIIVSTSGFQEGAVAHARRSGVALMHVVPSTTDRLMYIATCCCVGFDPFYWGVLQAWPRVPSCPEKKGAADPEGDEKWFYGLPRVASVVRELLDPDEEYGADMRT